MRLIKLAMIPIALICLSGCATLASNAAIGTVAERVCKNSNLVVPMLIAGLAQSEAIEDPVKREAAVAGFRLSLAAFQSCPTYQTDVLADPVTDSGP